MREPEQHLPEQHGNEAAALARGGVPPREQQAGAGADVFEEDPMALAQAAQERLAGSLAAIRAVPLTIRDEPSLVFRP